MKKLSLSAVISCAVILSAAQSNTAYSVEPMSEADMGNVSAESGNVLDIMGAPASGDAESAQPGDKQRNNSNEQALASANYIEADQSLEPRANTSLTPLSPDSLDGASTFKISERADGQTGVATLYYDEKDNVTSSSYNGNTLTIDQNVQIQQVQINQVRHSATDLPRGDYTFGNIHVTGAVSITGR